MFWVSENLGSLRYRGRGTKRGQYGHNKNLTNIALDAGTSNCELRLGAQKKIIILSSQPFILHQ